MMLAIVLGLVVAVDTATVSPPTVVGVLEDFSRFESGPVGDGHVVHFRWNEAELRRARDISRVECVAGDDGSRRLHVRVDGPLPDSQPMVPLVRLSPHFPPTADVLRIHVRLISGTFRLFVGGPTAYFADSDVYSIAHTLTADDGPRDVVLDVSLNHPLRRNFRRAGFSTEARRIYYTRWAQEPLGVFITPDSQGEMSLNRIELVNVGEGRPFPEFAPTDVRHVRTIADFEDGRLDRAFNLYMADGEVEWFEASWRRDRPLRFAPAELRITADPQRKRNVLVGTGRYAEEVHCTGVRTDGAADANALQILLRHDASGYRNVVVGMGRAEPVDFLVFVAPPSPPFPWSSLGPDGELRRGPGPGFDYQFSYRVVRSRSDLDTAVYHARRYVRPDERTTLVLPVEDFVCIYGSGAYRERFLSNQPLTCGDVTAIAWLTPWSRSGGRDVDVTTRVDEIDFVHVPGDAESHRSFWQMNPATPQRWTESDGGRLRTLYLGDES